MTSIAEFSVGADDFPLGRVFETHPDARFELDRVVPTGDTAMPYFWVFDADAVGVLGVLDDLPELRSVVLMENLDDRGLFRADWKPEHLGIMGAIMATDVTVVSATGSASGWEFQLRADETDAFAAFTQACTDRDVRTTLTRLNRLSEATTADEYGLTDDQREALVLAYEAGYYDDPRRTTLDALADRLDISRQAFAARLRRGYRNLVGAALVEAGSDDT